MEKSRAYVLITGAGAGLGRHFAIEFARRGFDLLLVSLHEHELDETLAAVKVQAPASDVLTYAADLCDPGSPAELLQWLQTRELPLAGLVNNVGGGYYGAYDEMSYAELDRLLHLNVVLVHRLSRLLLPLLLGNTPAFILNVSSLAAYFPLPYKVLYSASKAFSLQYSLALHAELKSRGVHVAVIAPGPMETNDLVRDQLRNLGWRRAIYGIHKPEHVARITVEGVLKKKTLIFISFRERLLLLVRSLAPLSRWATIIDMLAHKPEPKGKTEKPLDRVHS